MRCCAAHQGAAEPVMAYEELLATAPSKSNRHDVCPARAAYATHGMRHLLLGCAASATCSSLHPPQHTTAPLYTVPLCRCPRQTRRQYKQRAALLVSLLTAEPSNFDQRMAAVKANLDEGMLALVDKRLELAATHQQVGGQKGAGQGGLWGSDSGCKAGAGCHTPAGGATGGRGRGQGYLEALAVGQRWSWLSYTSR